MPKTYSTDELGDKSLCPVCNGRGSVPCSNQNCRGGYENVVVKKYFSGARLTENRKCEICAGTGRVMCTRCSGDGWVQVWK